VPALFSGGVQWCIFTEVLIGGGSAYFVNEFMTLVLEISELSF
jgi:hypothetical protein